MPMRSALSRVDRRGGSADAAGLAAPGAEAGVRVRRLGLEIEPRTTLAGHPDLDRGERLLDEAPAATLCRRTGYVGIRPRPLGLRQRYEAQKAVGDLLDNLGGAVKSSGLTI
jgi:hypothetical protein